MAAVIAVIAASAQALQGLICLSITSTFASGISLAAIFITVWFSDACSESIVLIRIVCYGNVQYVISECFMCPTIDQVLQMYAGFLQRRDAIPSGLRHRNLYTCIVH